MQGWLIGLLVRAVIVYVSRATVPCFNTEAAKAARPEQLEQAVRVARSPIHPDE